MSEHANSEFMLNDAQDAQSEGLWSALVFCVAHPVRYARAVLG